MAADAGTRGANKVILANGYLCWRTRGFWWQQKLEQNTLCECEIRFKYIIFVQTGGRAE